MVRVSIDPDAVMGVVAQIQAAITSIGREWEQVARAGGRAGLVGDRLPGLGQHLDTAQALAAQLAARVDLAVLVNTGGVWTAPGTGAAPAGRVLHYDVPDDTATATSQALGGALGERLTDLAGQGVHATRDQVQAWDEAATVLARYADDSQVMAALGAHLDPATVLALPVRLHDLGAAFEAGALDSEQWWDTDTLTVDHLVGVQQRFMDALGSGVAASTAAMGTDQATAWAQDLGAAATADPAAAWALSHLLTDGQYTAPFLTAVGATLLKAEDANPGLWAPGASATVAGWSLGGLDDPAYADPFTGLLTAMTTTPSALVDLLYDPTLTLDADNPDNPENAPDATTVGLSQAELRAAARVDLLVGRDTFPTTAAALGRALAAAGTVFHTTTATDGDQRRSALITTATVSAYAGHGVPTQARGPLADLLAAYIPDVDRDLAYRHNMSGLQDGYSNEWERGLPVGAWFRTDELSQFVRAVIRDQEAAAGLGAAQAAWTAHRLDVATATGQLVPDEGDPARIATAVEDSARAQAALLALTGANITEDVGAQNRGASVLLDAAAAVPSLARLSPGPGTVLSFATGQAHTMLSGRLDARQDDAAHDQLLIRDELTDSLKVSAALALAENGHLPDNPDAYVDVNNGQTRDWYQAWSAGRDISADTALRQDLLAWLNTEQPGTPIKDLLEDMDLQSDYWHDNTQEHQ